MKTEPILIRIYKGILRCKYKQLAGSKISLSRVPPTTLVWESRGSQAQIKSHSKPSWVGFVGPRCCNYLLCLHQFCSNLCNLLVASDKAFQCNRASRSSGTSCPDYCRALGRDEAIYNDISPQGVINALLVIFSDIVNTWHITSPEIY